MEDFCSVLDVLGPEHLNLRMRATDLEGALGVLLSLGGGSDCRWLAWG